MTGSQNGTIGDPEDEPYRVLWGQDGLSNTSHTLVASMWVEGTYVIVDALMYALNILPPALLIPFYSYTILEPDDCPSPSDTVTLGILSPTSTPSSAAPSSTSSASTAVGSSNKLTKVVSIAVAVAAAVMFVMFLWYHRRRKPRISVAGLSVPSMVSLSGGYSTKFPIPIVIPSGSGRGSSPSKTPYTSARRPQVRPTRDVITNLNLPPVSGQYPSSSLLPSKSRDLHEIADSSTDQHNSSALQTRNASANASSMSVHNNPSLQSRPPPFHGWSSEYRRDITPPDSRDDSVEYNIDTTGRLDEPASFPRSVSPQSLASASEYSQSSRSSAIGAVLVYSWSPAPVRSLGTATPPELMSLERSGGSWRSEVESSAAFWQPPRNNRPPTSGLGRESAVPPVPAGIDYEPRSDEAPRRR
jgi:hypothetical protein